MQEISGLIADSNSTNGNYVFWALGDGGAPAKLYKYELKNLDSFTIGKQNEMDTAKLVDSTTFSNASNVDWEELSHSPTHIFIGDFGNNNGNRRNLRIYRFKRSELGFKNVAVDTLNISYANQTDFSSQTFHPWDCEAMYWENDSIIMLSKGLANSNIYIYKIPDIPGTYSMKPVDSFQSTQLITGASKNLHSMNAAPDLIGYNFNSSFKLLSVFSRLVLPFKNNWDFSPSEKLMEPHQAESIAGPLISEGVFQMAFASERYDGKNARIYVYGVYGEARKVQNISAIVHPNPVQNDLHINLKAIPYARAVFSDVFGKWIINSPIHQGDNLMDLSGLNKGIYFIRIYGPNRAVFIQKFIKE